MYYIGIDVHSKRCVSTIKGRTKDILALVDFGDQITKIYYQGAGAAQHIFEQPCGGHHIFEHRDEMRRDRIRGRSQNTLLSSERRRSPKFTRAR